MQDKVSEGPLARECFVNREEVIKEFLSRIHRPRRDVLFLHGEGGIGKTRVLDHLEDNYCKRLVRQTTSILEPWEQFDRFPACELVEAYSELQTEEIPTARLNFGSTALDKDPRKAFEGLTQIRLKLGLPAERFQAACLIYLKMEGRLTKEAMSRIFPGEHAAAVASLVDGLSPNGLMSVAAPIFSGVILAAAPHVASGGPHLAHVTVALANSIWASSAKLFGPSIEIWRAKRNLRKSRFDDLHRFKPEEIIDCLPELLAEDLNVWLDTGLGSFVLLFDSYQSFFGSDHFASGDRSSPDWWLRQFLSSLDLQKGAVIVSAGQEPPRWPPTIPCYTYALSDLKRADADLFLQKASVEPYSLRQSILRYATTEGKRVQPLLCALIADMYRILPSTSPPPDLDALTTNDSVQGKLQEVVERLVATSDNRIRYAVRAMAAPRRFDWELYRWVGRQTDYYSVSRDGFDILSALSCVIPSQGRSFAMHSLLRRTYGGAMADREIHLACVNYFRRDDGSNAEAIYHLYFLAPVEATAWWINQFREAAYASRHANCAALLAIRRDIGESFALEYSDEVGEYLGALGRRIEAEAEFDRSVGHWQALISDATEVQNYLGWGNALSSWANLLAARSEREGAEKKYAQAVDAFDRTLELAPDHFGALNNKGNALRSWADLLAARSEREAAEMKYAQAVELCDRALALAPEDVRAANNKGSALWRWADLLASRSEREAAEQKYAEAVDSCDRALALAPEDVGGLNNKGCALSKWADLLATYSEREAAEKKYAQAVGTFDRTLELAPGDVRALSNKGCTLFTWADLPATHSEWEAAENRYAQAVDSFNRTLELAPDDVRVLSNKGDALLKLADLLAARNELHGAETKYAQAVDSLDRALTLASDYVRAMVNRGNALWRWADLLAARSEPDGAEEKCVRAVDSYDRALALAPDDVGALSCKGSALRSWGALLVMRNEPDEADRKYVQSVNSHNRALALAPNDAGCLSCKGIALRSWGSLLAARSEPDEADRKYVQAVDAYDRALALAPDDVRVLNNKGFALLCWADLLAARKERAATEKYVQAVESYDRVLTLAPEDGSVLNNKAIALARWADVRLSIGNEAAPAESRNQAEEVRKHVESVDSIL